MYRTENIDLLLPRILPQVLPCPRSMALDALQVVAADFCGQSGAMPLVLQESVLAGDCAIMLNPPKDVVMHHVRTVALDGNVIDSTSYMCSPYEITLRFMPQRDAVATVQGAARPIRTATTLPASLMEEWGDVLAFGALAKIKSMSGQGIQWADAQGAALNLQLYTEGVARARARIFRNRHGGGPLFASQGE